MYYALMFTLATASVQATDPDEVILIQENAPQQQQQLAASTSNLAVAEQLPGARIDAAELLQGLAGVQSDDRSNYAQDTRITLRGFGARSAFGVRGVLLRLDGIPLSMPDGQAQTSSILLDEPSNVQVIRGPQAVLYGNAAGGAIDWRSRAPDTNTVEASLVFGENATQRQRLQGEWVGDEDALRLVGARLRTDGPRPQNKAERDQLALRWYRQLSDSTQFILRLDDNDAPLLQDPSALTPSAWAADPEQTVGRAITYDTRKSIHHQQISASLQGSENWGQWHLNSWRGWREIEQFLPFAGDDLTSSGAVIDLRRQFTGAEAAVTLPVTDTLDLTSGLTWAEQRDRRRGFVNDLGVKGDLRRDELGRVRTHALFSQANWQVNESLSLSAGARHQKLRFSVEDYYTLAGLNPDDSGQQDLSANTWMLGSNYQFNDTWTGFIATGRGFESPTLTELAYSRTGTGLNATLGPAFNRQWEAGVKCRGAIFSCQLSMFDIQTDNEIVVDTSIDGRTIYTNAEQTKRQGVELEGNAELSESLDVRFSASYLDATFSNGLRLPGIAKQQAYLQFNWLPTQSTDTLVQIAADYRGDVMATDANDVIAPSHVIWSAALQTRYQWQGLELNPWLKIHNLFDRAYVGSVVVNQGSGRAFEPGRAREAMLGITIRHNY